MVNDVDVGVDVKDVFLDWDEILFTVVMPMELLFLRLVLNARADSVQHSTLRTNARAFGLIFIFRSVLFAIYSYGLLYGRRTLRYLSLCFCMSDTNSSKDPFSFGVWMID